MLDLKNMQKRPQTPKPIFLGLESEKYENHIPFFEDVVKHFKLAHEMSVHNGSYTSPNELVRFRNEATPIWVGIQKHCKNGVII